MSTLTATEKTYLEKLLEMGDGYVLHYSDASYGELFKRHNINIHTQKYQTYGTSKAKKMRSFWEQAPDNVVGKVLAEIIDAYEASCEINKIEIDRTILQRSREIINRLLKGVKSPEVPSEDDFLERDFSSPNLNKLPVDSSIADVIDHRLKEAHIALKAGANLSVIFLCGSVLEAILLGAAIKKPELFNKSTVAPRNQDKKVKHFQDWTLAQLIDAACELKLLNPDVKVFSHGLRDFRNYIHPYQQLHSGFSPDQHTAKLCFQVLKAALADVAGER